MGKFRAPQSLASLGRRFLFRGGILLIPLAALLAISPLISRGISCGHDFEFHLISWLETQRSWSEGILYPHWAQSPNWGAGEARFVFYPPLTWMLGAALGYLIPWQWVPAALTFLCLVAAGLSTRMLARRFLPARSATLAGIIATTTPYALFTAYERTAFGELAATAWIPVLLLSALQHTNVPDCALATTALSSKERLKKVLRRELTAALTGSTQLAIVLAAIWLTNAPAGVMASYLLAFVALVASVICRQWWPVLRAAVATPIALGLAAFYLVPAAWEQRWISIQQAVDVGMRVTDSWLFAHHSSPDLQLHDQVLHSASMIVVITSGATLAAIFISLLLRKLPPASRHFWVTLAMLVPCLFLLQLPISVPIWSLLPKLQFLQFPWRWLMVIGTPFAVFLAIATPLENTRARIWSAVAWTTILVIITSSATRLFFQQCDDEDQVGNQIAIFHNGTGVEGTDEYAAAGSDNSLIPSGLPDGCLVTDPNQELGESEAGASPVWYSEQGSCDDTYSAQLWQNEHKVLKIDSDHGGFVVLRLSRDPAWKITVNGAIVNAIPNREDGLIDVPVSAGTSTIKVSWMTTPDVRQGRWISLASLVVLIGTWMGERRLRAFRLSSRECQ